MPQSKLLADAIVERAHAHMAAACWAGAPWGIRHLLGWRRSATDDGQAWVTLESELEDLPLPRFAQLWSRSSLVSDGWTASASPKYAAP
eukprot:scaffold17812_cov36-Tisochrysis_lutea.AAC.1